MARSSSRPLCLAFLFVSAAASTGSVGCGEEKSNEDRFFDEMRHEIDVVQSEGTPSEEGFDKALIGTADPRRFRTVEVGPPPPPAFPPDGFAPPYDVQEGPRRTDTGEARSAPVAPADDGPNPSFTNANLAASLAAYDAPHASASKAGAKPSVAAAKPGADAGAR